MSEFINELIIKIYNEYLIGRKRPVIGSQLGSNPPFLRFRQPFLLLFKSYINHKKLIFTLYFLLLFIVFYFIISNIY
jgi:hypothetical protein